ncbi:MAG TPA: hypothetical protein VGI32_03830 [Steroidobacteraceae bacterium]
MRQLYFISAAAFAIAAATFAPPALAATRASPASCHQAVNGLISLLDGKMDNTALYRDTYAVVVNTCGPASPPAPAAQPATPPDRTTCDNLAAAMNDIIEDDKMNTPAFLKARSAFAQSCAPR